MNYNALSVVLIMIYFVLPFLVSAACLTLGIIVTASKPKETKILGISVILYSLAQLISSFLSNGINYVTRGNYTEVNFVNSVTQALCTLAASLFLCIYIHRNYQKKFIYIPIMLLPFVKGIYFAVINSVMNSMENYGPGTSYKISTFQSIANLLIGIAAGVILIVVFRKNKDKEKIIPHTYIIGIIVLITSVLINSLYVFAYAYAALTYSKGSASSDVSPILSGLLGSSQIMLMVFSTIGVLVSLIFPIYLLVMVRKKVREGKQEEAEIPALENT